ncbi:hypothetical protein M0R45_026267 [Rubus argutus]|uniref:Secreted protein n=1 Tax=Rubus argutus TaxID=59490 RepID=A0AAW1X0L2_RUBAR
MIRRQWHGFAASVLGFAAVSREDAAEGNGAGRWLRGSGDGRCGVWEEARAVEVGMADLKKFWGRKKRVIDYG